MNILPVNNFNLNNRGFLTKTKKSTQVSTPTFGLAKTKTIHIDTALFETSNKVADKTFEINLNLARQIRNLMEEPAKKVFRFIKKHFDDLVASEKYPNDPIRELKSRLKSVLSIKEKTGSRKWASLDEVINYMTDLIGVKFVIAEPNVNIVNGVLDRFIPMIKKGEIELYEVENKRPGVLCTERPDQRNKYDYASIDMLEKMIRIQNETWASEKGVKNPKTVSYNLEDYQESNYCAIHFLFKIPGKDSHIFELQVIGTDEDDAKFVDDKIWKRLRGKDIEKKYNPVIEIMEPLTNPAFFSAEEPEFAKKIVADAREILEEYRAGVFLFARQKAPSKYSKKGNIARFLPLQKRLFPPEIEQKYGIDSSAFDYNNLYEIMKKCDEKAEISTRNLKKAWAAQEIQKENRKQMTKKQSNRYK